MKKLGLGIPLVLLVILSWQWRALSARGQAERELRAERDELEVRESPAPLAAKSDEPAVPSGVPDSALPALTSELRALEMKNTLTNAGIVMLRREYLKHPALLEALARLTPGQVVATYEEWKAQDKGLPKGVKPGYSLRVVTELNPAGAAEMIARSENLEWLGIELPEALKNWFRKDPESMRGWLEDWNKNHPITNPQGPVKDRKAAMKAIFIDAVTGQGALWLTALEALRDPGGPSAAKIAERTKAKPDARGTTDFSARTDEVLQELAAKLETNEARLKFLRAANDATGGRANMGRFIGTTTQQSTFAQAALLVDMAPRFEPISGLHEISGRAIPATSLRFLVAQSPDGMPAERWAWLTRKETPTGDALKLLVKAWARGNDGATKEWIAGLPAGPTRDVAEAEYQEWAAQNIPKTRR